jgi:hypothetical protein
MSKFFIAAALGMGLLSAGTAAHASARAPHVGVSAGVTEVQYHGGYRRPHYVPPHRHYAPPPPRHYGWRAPQHRAYRQYGWR